MATLALWSACYPCLCCWRTAVRLSCLLPPPATCLQGHSGAELAEGAAPGADRPPVSKPKAKQVSRPKLQCGNTPDAL